MRQMTFLEGVAVAAAASVSGGVLFTLLGTLLPGIPLLRLLIAGISLAYVLYLLSRSRENVGRITVVAAWCVVAGVIWFLSPSLPLYVTTHIGLIWLVRSLYFYSSVLAALADLGLNGLSLAAAVWAAVNSGSLSLAIWCFFLTQALFVAIPTRLQGKKGWHRSGTGPEDRFQRAHRAAETAVRKLSNVH